MGQVMPELLKVGDVIDLGAGRTGEVIWPPRHNSKTKTTYIEIRTPEWVSRVIVPDGERVTTLEPEEET